MLYLETIKNLNTAVKGDKNIPEKEKEEASKLLSQLANLLALY